MKWLATIWVVILIALHQDFWLWTNKTLVFGLLPIGLVYHTGYAVAAALTMWMLVKVAWPKELDALDAPSQPPGQSVAGQSSADQGNRP